jgi:hypothetical protein
MADSLILVGKSTMLYKLYVAKSESNWILLLLLLR